MTSAADLIGTMIGTLHLTLGLGAAAATTLRSARGDRALLWFGVFTALYGVRLIARSDVVQRVTPFTPETWEAVDNLISYVILVPAVLLAASALGTAVRGVLRYLWIASSPSPGGQRRLLSRGQFMRIGGVAWKYSKRLMEPQVFT